MAGRSQSTDKQNELRKKRKGYTSRTSNQGQKASSGGSMETDNQGRPTANNPHSRNARTGISGKKM